MKKRPIQFIGYASGIASQDADSGTGPVIFQKSQLLNQLENPWNWVDMLYPQDHKMGKEALPIVAELCNRLAALTNKLAHQKELFATIGGDHSCAIGTWSGLATAAPGPIGLLWIDAHMDSHTPKTSPSQNIHGMPLAALLGFGPQELTQVYAPKVKLLPKNLCLIGLRSFEEAEEALLKSLGVKLYFMPEVQQRGLSVVMAEALEIINKDTVGYGISIDIDGIDPIDAPAVTTREAQGLRAQDLLHSLNQVRHHPKLLGLEIAEFNPKLDKNNVTEQLMVNLINTLLNALKESLL